MKFRILAIALLFCIGIVGTTNAQTTKKKVNKTQKKQIQRIQHGRTCGTLTKKETKQLAKQQKHIQKTKRKAAADGKVTRRERKEIKNKQQKASANIYRKKHN